MTEDTLIAVDLEDHEWFQLMTKAHERDITLNQYVREILELYIKRFPEHDGA